MKDLAQISCQIIAAVGSAKSNYFEAIDAAKKYDFAYAEKLMDEGAKLFVQGHQIHAELLQMSAEEDFNMPLLLVHAEDQMTSCETMRKLTEELIELYHHNFVLEKRINEFLK